MTGADPRAVEFALGKIDDGAIFERFAKDFLSKVLGAQFVPAGGLHDRGIDGFEHAFFGDRAHLTVYQVSIDQDPKSKIRDTLDKLRKKGVPAERLFYVTNRAVPKKDVLAEDMFGAYKIPIFIWDIAWFKDHVNDSPGTVKSYYVFVDSHMHTFSQPGQSYVVADLAGDPRLFVFLRQLWDEYRGDVPLEDILADTLILFALEGTDPDRDILMSREEILGKIARLVSFDVGLLTDGIDRRLDVLSRKPRRINHHRKEDKFVLPYPTRLEIQNRNLEDTALYEGFKESTEQKVRSYLGDEAEITPEEAFQLVERVLHKIFSQQGVEFADFVLQGEAARAVEKSLPDIVGEVVAQSGLRASPSRVGPSLLMAIRDVVYNGTPDQAEFLRRLSRTYMLLFLLKCDPQLATYFASMSSLLRIYVCTSILVPALSEYYLDERNRRYANLLKAARNAGAKLVVNDTIIGELAAHFRMIKKTFEDMHAGSEDVYAEEPEILYIHEIMIRAYFYARLRGQLSGFDSFLETFVSKNMLRLEDDLVEWLREEFGIEYVPDSSQNIEVDRYELQQLERELAEHKSSPEKARNDAKLVLTIYALRAQANEKGEAGIFGYRTWWLSTDTMTQRAVKKVCGTKYPTSAYMRADFLYNYVSIAPSREVIDKTFQVMFPSLVGVSISYHMPDEVTGVVHSFVREHASLNPGRVKSVLRELSDRLKTDQARANRQYVKHFLDEERDKLAQAPVG